MKPFFLMLLFINTLVLNAEQSTIKFAFVSHEDMSNNNLLNDSLKSLLQFIKSKNLNFQYTDATFFYDRFLDNQDLIKESTIGSIKALNFIHCNKKLTDKLIPILIVKKKDQQIPYYSSYFLINKRSGIDSLNSNKFKKFIYVNEKSTSGYYAPLHKLWEMGIIKTPSLEAIKTRWPNIEIETGDSPKTVISEVNSNEYTLGACGELPDSNSNSIVLLRYYLIPQDVIYISKNLEPYKNEIKEWLFKQINEYHTFENSSTIISGVDEFKAEHNVAYSDLEKMVERVDYCKQNPDETKLLFSDIDSPRKLFMFLSYLKFYEIGILLSILVTIFSAGISIGYKFPEIKNILKK